MRILAAAEQAANTRAAAAEDRLCLQVARGVVAADVLAALDGQRVRVDARAQHVQRRQSLAASASVGKFTGRGVEADSLDGARLQRAT